jgi:hypothetical protein
MAIYFGAGSFGMSYSGMSFSQANFNPSVSNRNNFAPSPQSGFGSQAALAGSGFNQSFFPSSPTPNFQGVPLSDVRLASQFVDRLIGDNDSALSFQESAIAANMLQFYNPNLSSLFSQIAVGLQQGNQNVDPNRDGKMTYQDLIFANIQPGDGASELTKLAAKSGNPEVVEPGDFVTQPPPPQDFQPEFVETVRQVSGFADFNRDGAVNQQEASFASNIFQNFAPNISKLFGQLASALQSGNTNVDPNRDGRMTYNNFFPFPTFAPIELDELTQLARRSGDPRLVEPGDLNPVTPG